MLNQVLLIQYLILEHDTSWVKYGDCINKTHDPVSSFLEYHFFSSFSFDGGEVYVHRKYLRTECVFVFSTSTQTKNQTPTRWRRSKWKEGVTETYKKGDRRYGRVLTPLSVWEKESSRDMSLQLRRHVYEDSRDTSSQGQDKHGDFILWRNEKCVTPYWRKLS